MLEAQKKHLIRWLAEKGTIFRETLWEAEPRKGHVTKRAPATGAPGMSALSSSPAAPEQDH